MLETFTVDSEKVLTIAEAARGVDRKNVALAGWATRRKNQTRSS